MNRRIIIASHSLLVWLGAGPLAAQAADPKPTVPVLRIDLARVGEQQWAVAAGKYSLVLENAVPTEPYTVYVSGAEPTALAPLAATQVATDNFRMLMGTAKSCEELTNALEALVNGDEEGMPRRRQATEAAILKCENAEANGRARKLLESTTRVLDREIDLPAETRVRVQVVRGKTTWPVILSSASRGQWQTLFGWTFAPNNDEEFYTEAEGEKFVIRSRARDEGSFTSLPSVFWTWLPTSQAYSDLQYGPTAGVGVTVGESGSRPAVFGGYLLRWSQNIGIVGGVTIYPHRRLDGRYAIGQTIGESLDGDKLNRNSIRGNWFFGAVFHFGSDPRKAAPKDEGEGEKKKGEKKAP